jgi:DNA polymerase-3 subunit epsilon
MNAKTRFVLAAVALGLLMTGPFLLTVGILWADIGAEERAGFLVAMDRWLPIGGLITIVTLFLGVQLCAPSSSSMYTACCAWRKPCA